MIDYSRLLARADDETLQDIVGPPAVRLLTLLDSSLARPSQLRRLVNGFRTPVEALRDPGVRAALLLLLPRAEADELARRLGLDASNPYPGLSTLKLVKGSTRERELLDFLDVDVPYEGGGEEETPATRQLSADYALFPHQRDAARRAVLVLSGRSGRVLLHMPTGAGKTRTSMHLIADHLRGREPTLVTWLAFSEELCEQAAQEFERAWQFLGDRPVNVHRFWGDHRCDLADLSDGLLVAGLSKMYAATRADLGFTARVADRTSLVVMDEAHQAIAETYQLVLRLLLVDPATVLLGLSATPGRTWNDPQVDRQLADFFDGHKVTLDVAGYASPVDYLIEEGYLARPDFVILPYDSQDFTSSEFADIEDAFEIPPGVLARLALDEQRNLLIVERTEKLLERHQRVLLFAATVEHSRLIATVLRARGHQADSVSANTPPGERERLIRHFRSDGGKARVLCNFGVLTAGFDAPRTSAALIARPTKSLVLYSQMVGRATRGPRASGNQAAEIVTVVDTALPGFRDMTEAFTNWEDVWQ